MILLKFEYKNCSNYDIFILKICALMRSIDLKQKTKILKNVQNLFSIFMF